MRRTPRPIALAAVLLLCVVTLAACNCAPTLRYVSVSPTSATINAGGTQQFTATAYYSDGTALVGQTGVTWSSSNTGIATVTGGGLATGIAGGTTTITATEAGASASATLTVNQAFTSIQVTCVPASVSVGVTSTCTALGNPGGVNITSQVNWNATAPAATITVAGVAKGAAVGTSTISATFGELTSNDFVLTVTSAVITGVTITPAANPIAIGNATIYTAMETLSDSTTQTPVGTVTWSANCNPNSEPPLPGAGSILGLTNATASTFGLGNGFAIANGTMAGSCAITATDTVTGGPFVVTSTLNVVTGKTHYAYVSNNGENDISQYNVDATSATPIAPMTVSNATATLPFQTIVHPNGKWVYEIDFNTRVHILDVAPASSSVPPPGALTLRSGDPSVLVGSSTGDTSKGAIDPTGRFMYVADYAVPSITVLTIDQTTGLLTVLQTITNPSAAPALVEPQDVLVDRLGSYVYIVDYGDGSTPGQINGYSIQASGSLAALAPTASWPTGAGPYYSTIDPTNIYIFVPNSTDNTVSEFQILSTGGLSPLSTIATAAFGATTPSFLINVTVDPTSKFLYVLDSPTATGAVYAFPLNLGVVGSMLAGSPYTYTYPLGTSADGIAMDPTGKLIAVENNFGNNVTPFAVAANGTLTVETAVTAGTTANAAPYFVTFLNAP